MSDREFLREEYLTLRREVEYAMAELATLERNCVIAIAAIYTWLATLLFREPVADPAAPALAIAWGVPVLLSVFGGLRSLSIGQHLRRLSAYLRRIEHEVFAENLHATGWEHFHQEAGRTKVRTVVTASFWLLLIAVTLLAARFGPEIHSLRSSLVI